MKKLDIELFRYHNVLFGRVLHMDESLRAKGKIITDGTYLIMSENIPELNAKKLFINGMDRSYDGATMCEEYKTKQEAIEAGVRYRELINKLNGEEKTQTVFPQVVKVI